MKKKKNGDCDLSSGFHVKDPFAALNISIFILGASPRFGYFMTLNKMVKNDQWGLILGGSLRPQWSTLTCHIPV